MKPVKSKIRILFIEDLPTDAEMAQRELKKHRIDFEARVIDNEINLREAFDNFKPNVIISDYSMPTFDGMTALNITRAQPVYFPFIILTGSMNEETAVACMKAGADDYVLKEKIRRLPFAVEEAIKKTKAKKEKDRIEAQLRASEKKFRDIFKKHSAVKLLIDPENGAIVEANEAAEGFYGWKVQELEQMNVAQINTLSQAEIKNEIEKARALNKTHFEFKHRKADGSICDVEIFSSKIEIENKEYLHSIVHDVSDKKQTEEQLKLLSRSVEQNPVSIVITNHHGNIEYVNPAFTKISGYSFDEVKGKNPRVLQSGQHPPGFYQNLWDTILSGKNWGGEFHNKKKNGEYYWEESIISPILDSQGNITHFVAVKEDITQQKHDEEERNRLQQQLYQAQKMESVGRLAGGVAHDINNKLTLIMGYSELGLGHLKEGQSFYNEFKQILQAGQQSRDITRQLLAFARKQTIAPEVLDLNEIVTDMLKMLQRLIGEDIKLAWIPAKTIWPVKMDPAQIDQILANLSVNARDAIEGVGEIRISTKNTILDESSCSDNPLFIPGQYVLLEISDTGCGMDNETQANIFEPFFTTKSTGKGTGLGLSTVYGIIKQNNGCIDVQSEPGKGTTFKLYLPRYKGKSEPKSVKRTDEVPYGKGETILIVEDEYAILSLTKVMLKELGYNVLAATTPNEALVISRTHSTGIDLILTDVIMPEMNGRILADELLKVYPNIKVLFMSGYTADVIAKQGKIRKGMNYIQKPFHIKQLGTQVRKALEGKS
ncbi:MAG: PAS domain S-box protein [Caldithrix sp.]|nr:PAS domain S-box protein [Caldithrix sp.]